ncbi:MAG: hypothetical protein LBQ33_01645 [Oscillospiraceae bacterium]|jgi:hypothetical protein|nr:hypothetical protein [Oscillospiraceae bacterium]
MEGKAWQRREELLRRSLPWLAGGLCCATTVLLLVFSPAAAQGAKEGLLLCAQVIVPSLFPFFVLGAIFAALLQQQQTGGGKRRLVARGMWALFRQPPAALGTILLSFLGGYPMGAKSAAQLLERGLLSREQARRLLLFCVNAGPAYVVGVVGSSLMGSRKAGLLALLALTLSGLAIGWISRFLAAGGNTSPLAKRPDAAQCEKPSAANKTASEASATASLLGAVTQATGAILHVCAWVVLFSCLCALLRLLPQGMHGAIPSLNAILEVSSGAVQVVRTGQGLPILCAVLGWGGLSVHCQILGDVRKTGLALRWFWIARLLHAALAAALCTQLLRWFPCGLPTAALQSAQSIRPWAISAPAAAAALFFCAFLILDLDLNRKIC